MNPHQPALLDEVALLTDRPDAGLARGAIGIVVEPLDDATSLVEFSDDAGAAQAIDPCLDRASGLSATLRPDRV